MQRDRARVAPWLDAARPLEGARVLEVGCGTGSSTAVLAEQGARVLALDVDAAAVAVARERCRLLGLDAIDFVTGNAADALPKLEGERFDFAILYASLEHMTGPERLRVLRQSWELLHPGDLLCVIETPNRLWPFDSHTSLLPFFHWLPDELAFAYSRHSPRPFFRERYRDCDAESMLHFLRRGRGVSFHELEQAWLRPAGSLDVVSSLRSFREGGRFAGRLRAWRERGSFEARGRALLAELAPGLHPGFFDPMLNLVLRRDQSSR